MLDKWKQQTKQMQQEKQSKLDNLGCKRTLNMDRLMEMRRKVSSTHGRADIAQLYGTLTCSKLNE